MQGSGFSFLPYLPLEDKRHFHGEFLRVDCAPGTRVSNATGTAAVVRRLRRPLLIAVRMLGADALMSCLDLLWQLADSRRPRFK